MNSTSPSAAESASEVTAALAPRAMEMSADIYQLIVREIPQLRIAAVLASYIDKVSEEVVPAYESEKENWLRNQSVARAARVRALLRNEPVDVDSFEATWATGSGSIELQQTWVVGPRHARSRAERNAVVGTARMGHGVMVSWTSSR